jgi:hypothetical protein
MIVVGPGRVGAALMRAFPEATLVGRLGPDEGLRTPHPGAPILVATRADALPDVIARTHPVNRPDLVFLQNGMIRPVLAEHGLLEATQGLLYFAATDRSGKVDAGRESVLWGRHAPLLAGRLQAAGIPTRSEADADRFRAEGATKLAWNLIFGLLGDHHDEPVGASARRQADIAALVSEITPVLELGFDVRLDPTRLQSEIVAYAQAIPTFRAAVRERPWRNGWLSEAAARAGLPVRLHDSLAG